MTAVFHFNIIDSNHENESFKAIARLIYWRFHVLNEADIRLLLTPTIKHQRKSRIDRSEKNRVRKPAESPKRLSDSQSDSQSASRKTQQSLYHPDEGSLYWGWDVTKDETRAALDQPARVQNDRNVKTHRLLALPEQKPPQSADASDAHQTDAGSTGSKRKRTSNANFSRYTGRKRSGSDSLVDHLTQHGNAKPAIFVNSSSKSDDEGDNTDDDQTLHLSETVASPPDPDVPHSQPSIPRKPLSVFDSFHKESIFISR